MKKIMTVLAVSVLLLPLYSISIERGREIINEVDENTTFSGIDLSAQLTIISEDPSDGIDKSKVLQFRNDDDDKFLMLIVEPVAQKGQGYLMIDDNLWFYDPQSRKFSHTSMKEQFNDSDANNSDFQESSLIEDYDVIQVEEAKLGSFDVYKIVMEANNNEVTYPKQILWVTQKNSLVLKSEDYSASDRLLRTSYYPSYTKAADTFIPNKMIFIDNLVENKKTTITISDISVKDLPDSLFTKAYVERVNN
ncbi:MAG: outer membrane lipoprotein-sorting protein [Sphaerochaetaceae bacterium]|nr:outer membrane lipoprotein-sorting protein [Sphaerochaetaceae bacterium]MDC7248146.1 outer membrane lipoprotein-sorting protein [Sphaerochaetaceae bacterium]